VVRLDLLLVLLAQVVPAQKLAIALDRELLEDLPHQLGLLRPAHSLQRVRALVLEAGQTEGAVLHDFACALVVPGGEIAGERGDEGGQLLRGPHLSGAHPLQQDPERLLVQIVSGRGIAGDGAENDADTTAEPLDELALGGSLPGPDAILSDPT
jgi:hypothetical protein